LRPPQVGKNKTNVKKSNAHKTANCQIGKKLEIRLAAAASREKVKKIKN